MRVKGVNLAVVEDEYTVGVLHVDMRWAIIILVVRGCFRGRPHVFSRLSLCRRRW